MDSEQDVVTRETTTRKQYKATALYTFLTASREGGYVVG